jgi:hypothetical protein
MSENHQIIQKYCPFCNEKLEHPFSNCELCGWNKEILKDLFNPERFENFGSALVKKIVETNIEIKLLKENFNDLMLKFDEICDSFVEFKALLFNLSKKKSYR